MESSTLVLFNCEVIINTAKCRHCINYRNTLRKAYHRWIARKQESPERHISTTSRANIRYLSTPERKKRFNTLKARSVAVERKLTKKIWKSAEKEGVRFEKGMHNDFCNIMERMRSERDTLMKALSDTSFGSSNYRL